MFETVDHLVPGRVIAGMGIGDDKSAAEDEAAGVARDTPEQRFARAGALADQLRSCGITTWIVGRSARARKTAAAHADAANFWGCTVGEFIEDAPAAAPRR